MEKQGGKIGLSPSTLKDLGGGGGLEPPHPSFSDVYTLLLMYNNQNHCTVRSSACLSDDPVPIMAFSISKIYSALGLKVHTGKDKKHVMYTLYVLIYSCPPTYFFT